MSQTAIIQQIAIITVVMLFADAVWLTTTAASTRQIFAAIQGQPLTIRWIPAVAVYIIMIAAVWFFAVQPSTTWQEAGGRGAALGFAAYGIYDMTNYATIAKYPLSFALTDMTWGAFLFGVSAAAATASK
jgi:uncharacterized membrane protein